MLEWAYQLYNVAFTALPILIYAVFDRFVLVDSDVDNSIHSCLIFDRSQ